MYVSKFHDRIVVIKDATHLNAITDVGLDLTAQRICSIYAAGFALSAVRRQPATECNTLTGHANTIIAFVLVLPKIYLFRSKQADLHCNKMQSFRSFIGTKIKP